MKCTNKQFIPGKLDGPCGTEMEKVGEVDNMGLGLGTQTLYQCPSCKSIFLD